MPRTDVSFNTRDNVTLRGWFFTPPQTSSKPLPCLILTHGISCVIDMCLSEIATSFVSALPITCLVYDHRGLGRSDTAPNTPRLEILPFEQCADMQDAVTFASTLPSVDADRIGLWGYSFAGGHVLHLGHKDHRVKAVIALGAMTDGKEQSAQLIPLSMFAVIRKAHDEDRLARLKGEKPAMFPMVSDDPSVPCTLGNPESWEFFEKWRPEKREGSTWRNEITLRSLEEIPGWVTPKASLPYISPTPVLMVVATRDMNGDPNMQLRQYDLIAEPKEMCIVDSNHYEMVDKGKIREKINMREIEFLRRTLCAES